MKNSYLVWCLYFRYLLREISVLNSIHL